MLSYCLKCRGIQKVKIQKLEGKKPGRIILLSKFEVCASKKSKFVTE